MRYLRIGWQKGGSKGLLQELAQVWGPFLLMGLIDCLDGVAGELPQRNLSQVTTGWVIALGLRFATLTFSGAGESLEAAV